MPTATSPQTKLAQNDRIPPLENFGIRDPRVRHMRMDATCPFPVFTCTAATGDGLVVSEPFLLLSTAKITPIPEGQVITIALTRGAGFETAKYDVRDTLRGQNVPAYHGGFLRR